MDEDFPSAADPLSYAVDVPYEAQLSKPMETERMASLDNRIGKRIYLLEDSISRKVSIALLARISDSSCAHVARFIFNKAKAGGCR
jgi:hypothetical protein